MSARPARHEGRTRWLLILPLLGLAAVAVGTVVLERLAPEADRVDLTVERVPPLAAETEEQCLRRSEDDEPPDVVEDFVPGGRVSSAQVYQCPIAYDGRDVSFAGEVVGEVLPRRGGAWVWLNDDPYALTVGPLVGHRERHGFNSGIAVWLPDGLHQRIEAPGRPGRRGDVVLVRGVFHQADPEDGGGITIRAEQLQRLAEPVEVEEPFHVLQAGVAGVLALGAVASLLWARRVRRR